MPVAMDTSRERTRLSLVQTAAMCAAPIPVSYCMCCQSHVRSSKFDQGRATKYMEILLRSVYRHCAGPC